MPYRAPWSRTGETICTQGVDRPLSRFWVWLARHPAVCHFVCTWSTVGALSQRMPSALVDFSGCRFWTARLHVQSQPLLHMAWQECVYTLHALRGKPQPPTSTNGSRHRSFQVYSARHHSATPCQIQFEIKYVCRGVEGITHVSLHTDTFECC